MPWASPSLPRRADKKGAMGGDVHAGRPHFLAVDQPALDVVARRAHRPGFHMRRIGAVFRLGQAEGEAVFPW